MNISRKNKSFRKISSLLKLRSCAHVLVALLLYTFISYVFLSPAVTVVSEEQNLCQFLSTDLHDPVRPSLVNAIEKAKASVLVITYSLADMKITDALNSASLRGKEVTVIYDPQGSPEATALLRTPIKAFGRKGKGIMHHKIVVIDNKEVWMGSANMTTTSLLQHGNLTIAMKSFAISNLLNTLKESLIDQTSFPSPPLLINTTLQKLHFFLHPEHGKLSLKELINRIDKATKRVFVAMYTFTHPQLLNALNQAKKRGIDVRVIFDHDSSLQTSKKAYVFCKKEKIRCGVRSKSGLLHYKTAIIDRTLFTGSCNWTKAGFLANNEAVLIIDPLTPSQEKWILQWWQTVESISTINK